MNIAYISISSYAGFAPNASHFYGRLRIGTEEVDLSYAMTRDQAARFNKDGRRTGDDFINRPGDVTCRFFSEEDVRAAAIQEVKNRPEVDLLLEGSKYICDPMPVLWAKDEEFGQRLQELYLEAKSVKFWERDEKAMEEISQRWGATICNIL